MEISNANFCVILAGGRGRRLWPCSRRLKPKQFIDFFGTGSTQLQTTYERFCNLMPKENIYVCTCQEYEQIVVEQLEGLPRENILVEPIHRNTAPSVAWASLRIMRRNPDANIVVTPSDLFVLNEEKFAANLSLGISYVSENNVLLVMGVKPTRPEPGYGYIQKGELSCKPDVYFVKSFTEKPEREFARMFMESGEFYWNTGLFVSNVKCLDKTFAKLLPDVLRNMKHMADNFTIDDEMEFVKSRYPAYPNMSFDNGILEKSSGVYVMECNFGWADLGTWHSTYEATSHNEGDNVVVDSEVMLEDCRNNIVKIPRDHVAVINGLDGFIVAEQGNMLLICPKHDSSALIRKYVNEVRLKYGDDFV